MKFLLKVLSYLPFGLVEVAEDEPEDHGFRAKSPGPIVRSHVWGHTMPLTPSEARRTMATWIVLIAGAGWAVLYPTCLYITHAMGR